MATAGEGEGPDTRGYRDALEGAAFARRRDRARVRVTGRDPAGMLQGILTNRVPDPPDSIESERGVVRGRGRYAAVLTPKGRMVTDLRAVRGPHLNDGLFLDVPAATLDRLLAHLGRYVPPRLARAEDVTSPTGALIVAGPAAVALLTREALGLRVEEQELAALTEDAWVWVDTGGPGLFVVRSGELAAACYDVIADRATVGALETRLEEAGAAPLTAADLEVLRVEAGRPAWGAELAEETLPPEAGIDARAIDHSKGCYTGQEVIVRIRDRGHVNRHLRGLRLGGADLPVRGTEVWIEGRDRPVGSVTTAAWSPRAEEGLGLGYLRREVNVPGEVRVGGPDGSPAMVAELESSEGAWWLD